ncbi:MAG: nitroreductase family protein [Clostridia bacterium]|nr:nitroreductase family protein [Clostridia bacterium]
MDCIKCGKCIAVCSSAAKPLTMTDEGVKINLEGCNACGHCVAICPVDALEHPLSGVQPLCGEPVDAETAEKFLRYARSVRYYKDEQIDPEKLTRMLTMGTYALTGSNRQGIRYVVVNGREKIQKLVDEFCTEAERFCPENPSIQWLMPRVEKFRNEGADDILRSCTTLIVAIGENTENHHKNAYFSCTFMSLMAPSLGIGTCWAGMYETLATNGAYDAKFRETYGVKENEAIHAVLMAGVPDVKFRRFAARNPLDVTYLD